MKILVLPSWYPPKGGRFFQELSETIHLQNNEVDILVNEINSIKTFRVFKKKSGQVKNEFGLNVYRNFFYNIPKFDFFSNKLWIKRTYKQYVKYAEKNGHPDIIHVHSSIWAGVVAQKIHKKHFVPYVITEHRSRFIDNTDEAKNLLPKKFYPYIKAALKSASLITCVSPALKQKLIDIESSVKEKNIIIPNTVDVNDFKFSETFVSKEPFIWFSLGNLLQVKGMDILLQAFSEHIKRVDNKIFLRIGGDGPEKNKLIQLCKNLKIEKNVIFLGHLERNKVIKEMQNSHAFVLSSRFEAFGVVYIEAMSCGKPVIGTDAGGQSSIINSENGYIVESENYLKLADAMNKMIEEYAGFDKKKIREEVVLKYEKNTIAKQYCSEFQKIVNGRHSS